MGLWGYKSSEPLSKGSGVKSLAEIHLEIYSQKPGLSELQFEFKIFLQEDLVVAASILRDFLFEFLYLLNWPRKHESICLRGLWIACFNASPFSG